MSYDNLLMGIKRYGTEPEDICRSTLGVDTAKIRERVIIAPWWVPTIFPGMDAAFVNVCESVQVWDVSYEGQEITYIKTGIGAPMVMDMVLVLGVTGCKKAVFIGSVGALDPGINIGDIVVPEYSVCGDGASRYLQAGLLKDNDVFGGRVYPDREMFDRLRNAAEEIGGRHDVRVHIGRNYSTDTIFVQFAHLDEIMGTGCNVIEMETAAAFRAAEMAGIALGALFSVSDNALTEKSLLSGRTDADMEYRKRVRQELFPPIIGKALG